MTGSRKRQLQRTRAKWVHLPPASALIAGSGVRADPSRTPSTNVECWAEIRNASSGIATPGRASTQPNRSSLESNLARSFDGRNSGRYFGGKIFEGA